MKQRLLQCIFLSIFLILPAAHDATAMETFVSIAPQKWLADQLGGKLVTTHVLIGEGQDPHTFEPTPRQMIRLSRARLYFTLDLEFEHQLVQKLKSSVKSLTFVDSASLVKKIPVTDHHGHAGDSNHEDPHIWLSPANLKVMAQIMAEAMIAADPLNGEEYQQNLEKVTQDLELLDKRIRQALQPFEGQSFYVFHPSFGYFAHDYKLQQKAVEIAGKAPRPKQLSRLISQAKKDNIKVIFVQPQFDPKTGLTIAQAIEGEVVPLNPLAEDVAANLETMMVKIKSALTK